MFRRTACPAFHWLPVPILLTVQTECVVGLVDAVFACRGSISQEEWDEAMRCGMDLKKVESYSKNR